MRPKLGELLVREGMIRPEQLEVALQAQVLFGGRLGTNLVDEESIDLDALARGLGMQHGVSAALEKHFTQIQPAVVAMIPQKMAVKHRVVPLGITVKSPKTLAVAFFEPAPAAADELAFAAGCRIFTTVAPELRLLFFLEKLYGIERKKRFLRIAPEQSKSPEAERRRYLSALDTSVALKAMEVASEGLDQEPKSFASRPSLELPPAPKQMGRPVPVAPTPSKEPVPVSPPRAPKRR